MKRYNQLKILKESRYETVIWGIPKGKKDRSEEILLYGGGKQLNQKQINIIKDLASKNGFHSLRIKNMDMSIKPDFSKVIK